MLRTSFYSLFGFIYIHVIKPLLFLFSADSVHTHMVSLGEFGSKIPGVSSLTAAVFNPPQPSLSQKLVGLDFSTPIGLAAGFDYQAQLTQTLPAWGFGFQTIGTISNLPCPGNPSPQLGRLPKSQSLWVNKGFKNPGADEVIKNLSGKNFNNHMGVSIGRTNIRANVTLKDSITDIVKGFEKFETTNLNHSYYELNISCPNLYGDVTFYPPKNLRQLLRAVDALKIKKPILVKMPIELTDSQTLQIIETITKFSPKGIIIGNLQKNRKDPALDPTEVAQFKKGNFSGKPTYIRSNQLIKLAYQKYRTELIIVGCGGVFSAEDAYTKIKLGASLVQLISGMIFQGPQLVAQINQGIFELLKEDGFTHISQAIGSDA